MKHIATAAFVLVALINSLPVIGVLGADRLQSLYGVALTDPDVLLAMRHRAVLLGIVGALLLVAAFRGQWRGLAAAVGIASMGSYALLALPLEAHGPAMQRVFWIDLVAIALLVCGYLISARRAAP